MNSQTDLENNGRKTWTIRLRTIVVALLLPLVLLAFTPNTANAGPIPTADVLSLLQTFNNNLIQNNPLMNSVQMSNAMNTFLEALEGSGLCSSSCVSTVTGTSWTNWAASGWPGASTIGQAIYSNSTQVYDILENFIAAANPGTTQGVLSQAEEYLMQNWATLSPQEQQELLTVLTPSSAVTLGGSTGAFGYSVGDIFATTAAGATGIGFTATAGAGVLFLGFFAGISQGVANANQLSQAAYQACMLAPACATASLIGDTAGALKWLTSGDPGIYTLGPNTLVGYDNNGVPYYANVNAEAIPGYTISVWPNETVSIEPNGGFAPTLGTVAGGVSYVATLMGNGEYLISYSNGNYATATLFGETMGGRILGGGNLPAGTFAASYGYPTIVNVEAGLNNSDPSSTDDSNCYTSTSWFSQGGGDYNGAVETTTVCP